MTTVSSVIDEDTARSINTGRAVLGEMLSAAQDRLQYAFMAFVIGLIGTIYVLRIFVFNKVKADLLARAQGSLTRQGAPDNTLEIIATTPFDVILLQVKIGLIVGIALALPVVVYFSRDALKRRGYWPRDLPRWKLAVVVVFAIALGLAGIGYGYFLFFPFVFEFLATNAFGAGFAPRYSIVKWAEFILLLSISFGLAAQLPLAMSGLSYAGIVRYETFRDKWKFAVVGIFVFGALFSPPDPFTQVMWAVPLLFLFLFSLGLARLAQTIRVSGEQLGFRSVLRANWNTVLGAGFVVGALVYVAISPAVGPTVYDLVGRSLPGVAAGLPRPGAGTGLPSETATLLWAAGGAVVGLLIGFVVVTFRAVAELERATAASVGAPADLDLGPLDAAGVRAAPNEVFAEMTEETALGYASAALEDGDDQKAQAILDRFDAAEEARAADGDADGAGAAAGSPDDADPEGGVVSRTGAGMLSAFTEDDVDEDDIGGYLYDIQFILSSLASKSFWVVAVFMAVMGGTFFVLYSGGIGYLRDRFTRQLPTQIVGPEQVKIVALHPVEQLIFEVKVSLIAGAVALVPLLLYWAWPALKERGFVKGNRNVLFTWAGATFAALVVGSLVGFLYVAPWIVSGLAYDAIQAGMIIDYRISNFGWLVFFTTIGVGLLATIPVSMVMLHRGGLVTYRVMRDRWRVAVVGILLVSMVVSDRGLFTMFLLGIPLIAAYGLGLALVWLLSLGGRDPKRPEEQTAD